MEQIGSLKVEGPAQCLQIRWGKKMLKRPVFRQEMKIEGEFGTSLTKRLPYATLNYYTLQPGEATGFEEPFTPYCIRRTVGNAIDHKSLCKFTDYTVKAKLTDHRFCYFRSLFVIRS